MTKKTNHPEGEGTLDLAAIQEFLDEAQASLSSVVRLTSDEKKRKAKLKRGAHEVLPLLAKLARKYAVQAPGASADDIESSLAYAQTLEPLLGTVTAMLGTLKDAHLSAEGVSWTNGTASYAILKRAAKSNVTLADELKPVTEWFRYHAKGKKAQGANASDGASAAGTNPKGGVAETTTTSAAPSASSTTAPSAQPAVKVEGAAAAPATTPGAVTTLPATAS